jgi:DinB superfamily
MFKGEIMHQRPEKNEYNPFYETYVSLVPETEILPALESQIEQTRVLLSGISDEKSLYRYAPDKWSIRQVIGHMIDGERVFAFRAFTFSRADTVQLFSFDEKQYVAQAGFDQVSLTDLCAEFVALRTANVLMFKHLTAQAWTRDGIASDNCITVLALAYIMVGHVRHHTKILQERYLSN